MTAADVAGLIEDRVARAPAASREQARIAAENAPRADTKPAFDRIVVSAADEIWVRSYASTPVTRAPTTWSVFGPAGEWLTEVTAPGAFMPWDNGADRIAGVWSDEDDVPHVRIYRLRTSPVQ